MLLKTSKDDDSSEVIQLQSSDFEIREGDKTNYSEYKRLKKSSNNGKMHSLKDKVSRSYNNLLSSIRSSSHRSSDTDSSCSRSNDVFSPISIDDFSNTEFRSGYNNSFTNAYTTYNSVSNTADRTLTLDDNSSCYDYFDNYLYDNNITCANNNAAKEVQPFWAKREPANYPNNNLDASTLLNNNSGGEFQGLANSFVNSDKDTNASTNNQSNMYDMEHELARIPSQNSILAPLTSATSDYLPNLNFHSDATHGEQIDGEFTAITRESMEQIIQHIFNIPNTNSNNALFNTNSDRDSNTRDTAARRGRVSSIYFEMTIDILDFDEDDEF